MTIRERGGAPLLAQNIFSAEVGGEDVAEVSPDVGGRRTAEHGLGALRSR
ncbi:MAG: hypothetical protein ACRYGP_00630 [Janthinobacterium lividum]